MPNQEAIQYSVGIEYGNPENHIVIEPPVSDEVLEQMIADGILVETTYAKSYVEDQKTYIPFGRLILGGHAMDEATSKYAGEIRQYLR